MALLSVCLYLFRTLFVALCTLEIAVFLMVRDLVFAFSLANLLPTLLFFATVTLVLFVVIWLIL